MVWLNFVYLLPVSLLPFGAALISRYEHESVALSLYGVLLLLIALARLIVWLYATNRPYLLYESIDRRVKTIGILIVAVPAALYVLAIGLADSAPDASLAIYVATPSCTSSSRSSVARPLRRAKPTSSRDPAVDGALGCASVPTRLQRPAGRVTPVTRPHISPPPSPTPNHTPDPEPPSAPATTRARSATPYHFPRPIFDGGAKPQVAWAVGRSGRHLSCDEDLLAQAA